jgi:ketosteroid isomerase-like protein
LFPLGEDFVSEGDTRAIVRELYDAYGRRDFERVAALIHDDIDWVIYAPMSVFPFAGPRRGRAAVLAAMAEIAKVFALEAYNPDVMIVDGERAALMSVVSYRQRATGRVLRVRIASFLRLQDGRLVEYREFIDSFDAVEQALGRELQL